VRGLALVAAIVLVAACGESPVPPQQVAGAVAVAEFAVVGDWPSYNRDLAGTRYSPLKQIDTINVSDLRKAWTYRLGSAAASGAASELTPVVVGGVLYASAADRVVALRADTGEEIWRYALEQGVPSRRGVTYWPGEGAEPGRLFFTAGRRLIALEASSGRKIVTFGSDGEIEMPVVYNAAPTRFENLLIVGSHGAPGSVRAFDARSGKQVWEFAAPEPQLLHWPFAFTIDVDRALLYAVFDGPGADDHFRGSQPVADSLGDSIVALDARSGEQRWQFQTVHHDIWNYDLPAPPGLLDVSIDGATVPLLAQASKTGYLYILNRVTGEPIFGIAETPMPQSDVPGEQTSATQPIPVKPEPLARVSFGGDDLVAAADTTAAHAAVCRELSERSGGLRNLGPFTPYRYRAPGAAPRSSVVFPGAAGGASWGGTAADPTLGLIFVNTTSEGSIGWIEQNAADPTAAQTGSGPRREQLPYRRMSAVSGSLVRFAANEAAAGSGDAEPLGNALDWPCQKPPWGELVAVNATTGDIAWRVPLGITEQLPDERQRTGRPNRGGPITTAGGVVFIGASDDRRFRAFDSRTGEELWVTELPLSAHSVPVTYLGGNGKQYVAIVAAGADGVHSVDAQAIIAYALP
jgi:quinoprotein glucose dehydrogenase